MPDANAWCGLLRCKSARKKRESRHKSWTKLTWVVSAGQRKFIWSSQINQVRFFTDAKRPRVRDSRKTLWMKNDGSFACHELLEARSLPLFLFAHCCPETEILSTCLNMLCPHDDRWRFWWKKRNHFRWSPFSLLVKPAVRFPPFIHSLWNGIPTEQRKK